MKNVIQTLFQTIEERKQNPIPGSYTASLFEMGEDEILKKIGEEAVEVIIAAANQGDERIVSEMADMLYHSLVLLAARDLQWTDIETELANRFKK